MYECKIVLFNIVSKCRKLPSILSYTKVHLFLCRLIISTNMSEVNYDLYTE